MPVSLTEMLQLLRYELTWIQQSGYPGRDDSDAADRSPFTQNHSCLNHGDPLRRHACRECALSMFVPEEHRSDEIPCHYIQLGEKSVAELLADPDRGRLVADLQKWLKEKIVQLEVQLEEQSRTQ